MNSRQRRKFEAQQHNDEIAYRKWLIEKTSNQARARVIRARPYGAIALAMMAGGLYGGH